jgi:Glycosyl transferases group 1
VDIFESELSESKAPCFVQLIRAAKHVLCLNRIIENEMKRVGAVCTSIFPLCSNIIPAARTAPNGPLRIVMSGALYKDLFGETKAMQLLREVWPQIRQDFPDAELHYSGAASWGLPDELRTQIHDHGLLSAESYQQLLNSSHMAYVPVSHPKNSDGRYSLPSRIPDYLIAGLPVIACTTDGTGIYEFFQSTPRECTRLVDSVNEFLSTVREFASDSDKWERTSQAARTYSAGAFAVKPAQEELFQRLNAAGNSQSMSTSI